jgi:hypothetical protein
LRETRGSNKEFEFLCARLCVLCDPVVDVRLVFQRRDTENTEVARRKRKLGSLPNKDCSCPFIRVICCNLRLIRLLV